VQEVLQNATDPEVSRDLAHHASGAIRQPRRHVDRVRAPSTGERVAVPLAGGVEFGETGAEAIARELDEEMGATPTRVEFLGVFEEIFAWAGQQRHELWLLYDVDLANPAIYETEQVDVTEDDGTSYVARWHDIAEFGLSYRLVPQGLLEFIGQNPR
jgi:8-oxo-dGTP pyrophosphatase MutT (NUDIX family)